MKYNSKTDLLTEAVRRTTSEPGNNGHPVAEPVSRPSNTCDSEHDLNARLRDPKGNSLNRGYHFSYPVAADVPLVETPLIDTIEVIRQHKPGLAARLHHYYDYVVRPILQRVHAVRDEEETKLTRHNEKVSRKNAAIESQQNQLRRDRDTATKEDKAALGKLEGVLAAQRQAALKASRTGVDYDPANPDPATQFPGRPRDLETIASELRLPWTPADQHLQMPEVLSWLTTILIGVMIGLSLGIMAGILLTDNLFRHPVVTVMFMAIGFAVAVCGKFAIRYNHQRVSERYWLGYPASNWLPLLVLAIAIDLFITVLDAIVEQQGLLANFRLREMTLALSNMAEHHSALQSSVFFLAGMLLAFPYVVTNVWEGYLSGRSHACLNRLRKVQSDEHHAAESEWRKQPRVQEMLHAIGEVKDRLREKALLEQRIAAISLPYDTNVQTLETQHEPELRDLPEAAKLRIQDAIDNWHGAHAIFDQMLHKALEVCELSPGFFDRRDSFVRRLRKPRKQSHDLRPD